jgi:hypothetical protein
VAETRPDKPTIYLQERYLVRCTCDWTSYPYLNEEGAVTEWREHQRTVHNTDTVGRSLAEESDRLLHRPWRQGRKVPRNIYAQVGEHPGDDDVAIGQLDSASLAHDAVWWHNSALGVDPAPT